MRKNRGSNDVSCTMMEIGGELTVGQPPLRVTSLGVNGAPRIAFGPHIDRQECVLVAELDRADIEALEDVRHGQDMVLGINLWGQAAVETEVSLAPSLRPVVKTTITPLHHGPLSMRIPKSDWVGVLRAMRYADMMLLEVPVPDPREFPGMKSVLAELEKAQGQIALGDYDSAVGVCRKALEELGKACGDDGAPEWMPEKGSILASKNTTPMSKEARTALLRYVALNYCHPPHHPADLPKKDTPPHRYTRVEATSFVTIVAALGTMSVPSPPKP